MGPRFPPLRPSDVTRLLHSSSGALQFLLQSSARQQVKLMLGSVKVWTVTQPVVNLQLLSPDELLGCFFSVFCCMMKDLQITSSFNWQTNCFWRLMSSCSCVTSEELVCFGSEADAFFFTLSHQSIKLCPRTFEPCLCTLW